MCLLDDRTRHVTPVFRDQVAPHSSHLTSVAASLAAVVEAHKSELVKLTFKVGG
jgi:hypothetical protein